MLDIPPHLEPVQELLGRSLARVEEVFNGAIASDLPPVKALCEHVERYRGKMLRPALVVLCGLAAGGEAGKTRNGEGGGSALSAQHSALPLEDHFVIAAVCEMIHMATLVHDDVLDDADTRRGGRTVNGLHGNEAAVILGDYLFSAAYRLCATLDRDGGRGGQRAALLIGQTGMTLCAGELLQLAHRGDLSLDEPTYFEIVDRKTASLIAAACRLGALTTLDLVEGLGEAERERIAGRFAEFGRLLGIAFQIQDDLLDLAGNQATVGKPLGRDAELGKVTLPVIHHLSVASAEQRGRTLLMLESAGARGAGEGGTEEGEMLAALEATGSLKHARQTARTLVTDAKRALMDADSGVPESPAKRFLLTMADAVVDRAF